MVSFTQPLIFTKRRPFFRGVFFNDRYDDLPPVCGILWFWLLLRLICHCNRLDLHATFVGVLKEWSRDVGPCKCPLEIHTARIPKSTEMPWKMVSQRLQI